MKLKQNIGMVNALVRITCGFTILAWATAKLVKKPSHSMPLFVAMMGAMKIAEGITRFCPVTYMIKQQANASTTQNGNQNQQKHETNQNQQSQQQFGTYSEKTNEDFLF
ncbi:YgaP family membrane protein [Bacillus alkalicellulosilyticus]|uniref:YgaP family membrane protein n=1 Tax=Alkalihalobacterium alkalicellulosilyticum TaxID=1912214 RepID=UPI0009981EC2|nr:DUF2892 domain-containing protein [Bacillus alkalicellulosilyticus]